MLAKPHAPCYNNNRDTRDAVLKIFSMEDLKMKKFVRILALTLTVLMLSMALVACAAKPNADPEKAKDALEEAGYTIVPGGSLAGLAYKDLDEIVIAVNEDEKGVVIFYFDDDDAAKDAFEDIADEYKDGEGSEDEDWVAPTRSGSMIYCGHKDAIKAAK